MLTTKQAKWVLSIIIPIFIGVLSFFVLAAKVPETKFITTSLEDLDNSKTTVMEFTGATLSTSLAISALPDDFATPIADSLADMNQYFIVILMALFLERLIVIEGVKFAFAIIIPIACGIYIAGFLVQRDFMKRFSYRLAILALALVLVVPVSTRVTNIVGADYLAYVEQTIDETEAGAGKINEVMTDGNEDQTIFEKLSDAFKTAIHGVSDLLEYFKNVIKKCINSIAILVVTTFVMPILTFFFFKWLLTELFSIHLPVHGDGLFVPKSWMKRFALQTNEAGSADQADTDQTDNR